jgi:hypothetical protein
MILPGLAREDLDALTDELTVLLGQIPDARLRAAALAKLVELSTLDHQVVGAFDRTVNVLSYMARVEACYRLCYQTRQN